MESLKDKPIQDQQAIRQVGVALVACGFTQLVDQFLVTGWLAVTILLVCGGYFYVQSLHQRNFGLVILSGIYWGISTGLLLMLGSVLPLSLLERVGGAIVAVGSGFLLVTVGLIFLRQRTPWWAFFVGWVIISVGMPFILEKTTLLDFIFWAITGIGSGLLIWGVGGRWFGLIIPGSIISSIGIGIYSAWANPVTTTGLAETGIMLVWFALGWGTIIVFSRVITTRFVWWPLIPGGILAVVGWGLYSGGNPNNALSFIGNTGSIGVLIFGLYLLLMRKGMKG